ncbi:MAG: GntR family transcriptional regulator [Oscillospiraceae bacterium]|jgi:GntR family transcriptional regulator|nr:GntR family transcriptional regulator [Oscillospiraceae bacterium]
MLLQLNFSSDAPIYQQIRNQVVTAIASGELKPGERLPTIRALAEEAGINMMTASKAYQLLKAEGYITTGHRDGAVVRLPEAGAEPETLEGLRLRLCELRLAGMGREEVLELCGKLYDGEVTGK